MRNVVYVIGQDLRAMWRKESGDQALRKRARKPTQVLPGPCSFLRCHHCPLALRKYANVQLPMILPPGITQWKALPIEKKVWT